MEDWNWHKEIKLFFFFTDYQKHVGFFLKTTFCVGTLHCEAKFKKCYSESISYMLSFVVNIYLLVNVNESWAAQVTAEAL